MRQKMTHYKCHVYRDKAGEFRWRLKAGNGRIVADSAEGYKTSNGARSAWEKIHYSLYALNYVGVIFDDKEDPSDE